MQRGDRAERAVPAAKLAGHSPLVRLNELLEVVAPGKPPISMAVDDLATTETALRCLNECLG